MEVSKFKHQGGVYKITNTVNGKCYIGRTMCFYRRSHHYIYDFNNQRSRQINEYLLRSMTKHGLDNFTFSVVEICEMDIVEDRELFWMEYFNSTDRDFGYNLRKDKSGAMIVHDSTRKKISDRLKLEWDSGTRDGHSEKLKASWDQRDRVAQSALMSKNLTKYVYVVQGLDFSETVFYTKLKELGLRGCIGKFAKDKTDVVDFKGYRIERVRLGT